MTTGSKTLFRQIQGLLIHKSAGTYQKINKLLYESTPPKVLDRFLSEKNYSVIKLLNRVDELAPKSPYKSTRVLFETIRTGPPDYEGFMPEVRMLPSELHKME